MDSSSTHGMVHSVVFTPGVSVITVIPDELSNMTYTKVQVIVKILFFIFPFPKTTRML